MLCTPSELVGPRSRFCIGGTYHRGSTLTGFAFSSLLIVVFNRGDRWMREERKRKFGG